MACFDALLCKESRVSRRHDAKRPFGKQAAFSRARVEKALDLFRAEMRHDMSLAGSATIKDISSKFAARR